MLRRRQVAELASRLVLELTSYCTEGAGHLAFDIRVGGEANKSSGGTYARSLNDALVLEVIQRAVTGGAAVLHSLPHDASDRRLSEHSRSG